MSSTTPRPRIGMAERVIYKGRRAYVMAAYPVGKEHMAYRIEMADTREILDVSEFGISLSMVG